jgi:type I restriction enzyme S subunit
MIENLKPYPETKDSGLPWLGDVPAHWEIRPAAGAFSPIRERNTGMKENTVLSLSYGRIVVKPAERLHGLVPESFETYQIVNPGDIVIRTTDLQNDKTSLRTGFVRDRGIITSAYLALSASAGVLPEFGYQFLNTWDISKAIYGYGSGLRQNLDFSDFRRMPVSVPPIAEQAAIARFLAWATNRLDRAIGAKRRIIALLQEQKQAIIHRAVTQGLDPSVPLKDSGIPWLGEIPEHWEVLALKRVLSRLVDCEHKTAPFVQQSDYRVIRTSAVRNGVLRWEGTYCTSAKAFTEWTQRAAPEAGDVIFTREAPAGEACIIPEGAKVCLGQRTVLMKPQRGIYDSQFLVHMIYTGPPRRLIELTCQGSTVSHFNMDDIGWMKVLAPPLSEQIEIVAKVAELTEAPSLAIDKTEREITLLREYRTRLIADMVTGKLDVREVAAGLPEKIEPSIQSDAAGVYGDEAEDDLDSDPIDTEED